MTFKTGVDETVSQHVVLVLELLIISHDLHQQIASAVSKVKRDL